MNGDYKTFIAFSVDVDRDVNCAVKGKVEALSTPMENNEAHFASCRKGLELLLELLERLDIEATFFFEAETALTLKNDFGLDLSSLMRRHEVGSHAYAHEDLLGTVSGIYIDKREKRNIIRRSMDVLTDIFPEYDIIGFRAPYCRIDADTIEILPELGFKYDSSLSLRADSPLKPIYEQRGNKSRILEIPLPIWLDEHNKKLASYFWPMHEGKRKAIDYIKTIKRISKASNNGIMILGTHPWHLVETYSKGLLSQAEIEDNMHNLELVLRTVMELPNCEFIKINEYIEKYIEFGV